MGLEEYLIKLAEDADRYVRDNVALGDEKQAEYFRGLASGLRLSADMAEFKGETQ